MAKKTAKKKRETKAEREARREKERDRKRRYRAQKRLEEAEARGEQLEAEKLAKIAADLEQDISQADLDRIEAVTKLAPTANDAQVAAALGMTAARYKQMMDSYPEAAFAAERGRHTTRKMVLGEILRKCREGDVRMLIHASKHILGWVDRVEHTGKGGGPIASDNLNVNVGEQGLSRKAVRNLKKQLIGVRVSREADDGGESANDDEDDNDEGTG